MLHLTSCEPLGPTEGAVISISVAPGEESPGERIMAAAAAIIINTICQMTSDPHIRHILATAIAATLVEGVSSSEVCGNVIH